MFKTNTLFFSLIFVCSVVDTTAQIDGDNIFSTNQVITIELEFPQADYWDQLVDNYQADDNNYITAALSLTDVTGTYSWDSVGVRFKGNSSYNHPNNKKSFKIDFNEFVSGQNYDGLKKLNFSNGFKDPSCIREKIFFDVCRDVGVPSPRASFSNVFFNGELLGFYTVIEQIDDQFLDWRILDDDGNLFKAGDNFGGGMGGGNAAADLVDYGLDPLIYIDRYELKTNKQENDWSDLISFIDFLNHSSDEELTNTLSLKLELNEYLRSASLDMLFSNLDSYTGSARNYYIYHNLTTDKWEWIKWDGNEAFGSYSNQAGDMISLAVNYCDDNRPLLQRIFDNEALYNQYLIEVCDLIDNYFNEDYMHSYIDEMYELVRNHVYADNNKMFSDNDFDTNINSNLSIIGGGGGSTNYGLKPFITDRVAYILSQINCSSGSQDEFTDSFSVHPNPSNDIFNIVFNSNNKQDIDLSVQNVLGEVIFSESLNNFNGDFKKSVDLSQHSNAIYILQLNTKDGIINKKLVLEK